jgi:glycosyltransferase involved in cell wall biosynthesis
VRVLFVSHYFHPEVGAPQTRILEAAQRLSARGHDVRVLTGFPNYPDGVIPEAYRARLLMRERLGDLRVIRSAVYPAPNRGFARRLVNHASFALTSVLAAPLAPAPDVVIAETPPLFTAASAVAIARGRRAPLILNVADLWPDSAVQLGALSNPRAIALAQRLERFAYRHSAAITVPTAGIHRTLVDRGWPPDRVIHFPNAVDVERFAALEPPADPLRRVIYCGTVGLAQGVGTLIDAATELGRGGTDLEFLVVGDGAQRAELADRARERGLDNVRFLGRVNRDRVPELLGGADIAVLSLRDLPLFEDALPSKLLEYMAAGRPVVASAAGEVARLLQRSQGGVSSPPGDAAALAQSIREVADDPARARKLGASGQRYVSAHYSRDAFVDRLEQIMLRVTQGRSAEDPPRTAGSSQ